MTGGQDALLRAADRCVACGLCVPRCPTYRKTQSEADSPRGRIQLMKGVLEGRLEASERFFQHIDLCLACRACEQACPNAVAYGELLDGVRAATLPRRTPGTGPRAWRERMLRAAMARPGWLEWVLPPLALLQRLGLLRPLSARLAGAASADALPPLPAAAGWRAHYAAEGAGRGEVSLFLGCVTRLADREALSAALRVLNRLGYAVRVPPQQTCCGALHLHSGERAAALRMAARNLEAFGPDATVLSVASGCGATLMEYGRGPGGAGLAVQDICTWLDGCQGWDALRVAPLEATVAVHDSCTLRNVMGAHEAVYRVLRRIPRLTVTPLPGNDQCCGAAGTYFLSQPAMAGELLADKIAAIAASGARFVASSNVGCAMHLRAGLRSAGLAVEVLHPAALIARQME